MRRILDVRDAVCRLVSLLGAVPAWQPLQGLCIDNCCLVANEGCFWERKERQEEDEPDDGCRNLINNTPAIVDSDETVGPLDNSHPIRVVLSTHPAMIMPKPTPTDKNDV